MHYITPAFAELWFFENSLKIIKNKGKKSWYVAKIQYMLPKLIDNCNEEFAL